MTRCPSPPERAAPDQAGPDQASGGLASGGLASRGFVLLLIASVGAFSNYAPMLSVVPMWAAHGHGVSGGASAVGGVGVVGGVGAATGVTMAGTVLAQLCMPWLQRRFRLAAVFAGGALVLGVPTFGYALSPAIGPVLAISAVRGAGFGVVAVAGSALAAELVPATHRGRAVGWYGMAVGVPQVVFLPLGVWVAQHVGFTVVFAATGAVSAAACPLMLAMLRPGTRRGGSRSRPAAGSGRSDSWASRLRPLSRPWLLMIVSAAAFGGITAFVPLLFTGSAVAPVALFGMSAGVMAGRWTAGVLSDRGVTGRRARSQNPRSYRPLSPVRARPGGYPPEPPGRLLLPSILACALGMAGFAAAAFASSALVALPAAVVYGLGFGALQNDTLVVMFARAGTGPGGHGLASTAWNLAFDAGTGVGATAIGWGSGLVGLGGAFGVSAAAIAALTPVAAGVRRSGDEPDPE